MVCRLFSELVCRTTGCAVQIETAYDTFLMQSMRQRMSGDMQINPNIKYADVPTRQTIRQVRRSGYCGVTCCRSVGMYMNC